MLDPRTEPMTIVDIPSLLASDIQYALVTPPEVPQSHIWSIYNHLYTTMEVAPFIV